MGEVEQALELVEETPPASRSVSPTAKSDTIYEVSNSGSCEPTIVPPTVPSDVVHRFDFSSLEIGEEDIWDIRIAFMGVFDAVTRQHMCPHTLSGEAGVIPIYELNCYTDSFVDTIGEEYYGLPTNEELLWFIKRCIIFITSSENAARLPRNICLCHNLREYSVFLTPFLDSLPCDWAIQSLELTQSASSMLDCDRRSDIKESVARAFEQKMLGNDAFHKDDRSGAIRCYEEAVACVTGALYHRPFCGRLERATQLLAICHSNIAAAFLMLGDGRDVRSAVEQAKKAIEIDPGYIKGYLHLARAYEILGEEEKLRELIQIARRIRGFKKNPNFVEIASRLEPKAKCNTKNN